MTQLPLSIVPRVKYSPSGFITHTGAAAVCAELKSDLDSEDFRIRFITGEPRSGKSHFLVWAFGCAADRGISAIEIECSEGLDLASHIDAIPLGGLILIDDIDRLLENVFPGSSGDFVAFVERARLMRCKLLLTSTLEAERLPCDEHVMSRLKPGLGGSLEPPSEEDVPQLLKQIAHQHGVEMGDRLAQSMSLRLDRSVSGLEKFVLNSAERALSAGSFHRALREKS